MVRWFAAFFRVAFAVFAALAALACASPPRAQRALAPALSANPAPVVVSTTNNESLPDHGAAAVPVTAADPQWGGGLAPVTVVAFNDFECPFCSRVQPALDQIRRTYGPDRVRIVWKNNPLPFHKDARPTADAAQAVFVLGGSKAFWSFHDQAFANQKDLTPENHERWALAAGIELVKFREMLRSEAISAKVDDDIALAKRVGATGTPAFRINGVTLTGAQPFEKFREVIDAGLLEAKQLVESGTSPKDVYVLLTNRNFREPPQRTATAADVEEDFGVWKIPVRRDDPVRGPADALVTIVEFSEFQCPFCKRVRPTLDAILGAYPKDVRLVWKDNPLSFHPRARPSAILARFAFEKRGNKAFWQVHDGLFASQPELDDEALRRVAEQAGLLWSPIALALEKDRAPKIDESVDLANDFAARGTPHFFINGVRLAGAQPHEKFEERVAQALEVARELVKHGVPRAKVYEAILKDAMAPPLPEKKLVPPPDATTPFRGNASAPVVIQEFSDFQCPFCKRVQPTLAELEAAFGSKVKIVWRNLPLPFHADAALAAEAAHEAFTQRGNPGFWRFHDAVLEAQPTGIGRDVLESIADRLGLDRVRFRAALDSRKHRPKIEADAQIARDADINGTPAFVINGYFLSGAQPAPAFKRIIRVALDERAKRSP
ncbi:MAG TPA: thioredoxin domain-containing protein [Polyangiaceae bacterium]|nr:thioredoxin domain-containing protein [Polyangiaceae bacterium]